MKLPLYIGGALLLATAALWALAAISAPLFEGSSWSMDPAGARRAIISISLTGLVGAAAILGGFFVR